MIKCPRASTLAPSGQSCTAGRVIWQLHGAEDIPPAPPRPPDTACDLVRARAACTASADLYEARACAFRAQVRAAQDLLAMPPRLERRRSELLDLTQSAERRL